MALGEAEVQNQIKHMIGFIEQESQEKEEEITAKGEEEFNIEKGRLVQQNRVKIIDFYDRKSKQSELQKKIQTSQLQNGGRLRVLKVREDVIKALREDALKKLVEMISDEELYKQLLKELIIQSLYQLLEDSVSIRCRPADLAIVQEVLDPAVQAFKDGCNRDVTVVIDADNCLSPDIVGGVELFNPTGKIKVSNTIENRLDLLCSQMEPELKEMLFGANANRKFRD